MTALEIGSQDTIKRTRRRHRKSKTGCLECKRRRIKCDETKPACTRCILGFDKCVYPSAPQVTTKDQRDDHLILSTSTSLLTPLPSSSPYSDRSLSIEAPPPPNPAYLTPNNCSNAPNDVQGLSHIDLYQHYLQETSLTLSLRESDYTVLHIGMPTLALRSKTVFHSLLAVSAASLAWNMTSQVPAPDTEAVNRVLLVGYQHYNLASEQMRETISGPGALRLEPLVASALILVPFATASQQINHWISRRSGVQNGRKVLSSTPRDVIVIMRGVRTMLQALDCGGLDTIDDQSSETEGRIGSLSSVPTFATPAPSRTHVMSAIIATTSCSAFSTLQKHLEPVLPDQSNCRDNALSACSAAFSILEYIRSTAFSPASSPPSPLPSLVTDSTKSTFSQISPRLRSFAHQSFALHSTPPQPTQPLTRFFLSFLIQVPQSYLDLVLPLLDQRLESPGGNIPAALTREQALALDIYAHWSVLMFLTEEESWWIGRLPKVTLEGMVNRYGGGFVGEFWEDGEKWWPGCMLDVLGVVEGFK